MAELPQYQRTILRQTQETDMSEANVWKTLAAQMDNFSSQIGAYAQQDTARKSRSAAAEKSAQNDLRLSNERATKVYVDGKESDVMTSLSQLSIDFDNDYEGYIQAANNLEKTWLENKELDAVGGMRAAFTTMVKNKKQQYGVDPYKNYVAKEKEEGKRVGVTNIKDFVTDANHQVSQFIDSVSDGSIETLDDPDNYAKQVDMVAGKYMTLQAKIDDLVKINDFTADEAMALESEMELKFFSGVIKAQISNEMKNDRGWTAIDEFEDNPATFISSRKHLQALIPKGVKISDEMAESIYDDIFQHYKDTQSEADYLETKLEKELAAEHADMFSTIFASVVNPEVQVEQYTIRALLAENDISTDGHDTLLKALAQETYVKDDALKLFDLNRLIIDPNSSADELETMITNAFLDGDISGASASGLLIKNLEGKQAKNKEYFQIGWNAIATGLVGNPDMMDAGSGQVLNFAQEEYYKRVQGYTDDNNKYHPPEDAMEIYNEIVEKYKPMMVDSADDSEVVEKLDITYPTNIDPEVGASFETMEFNKSSGWNTFFIGTPDAPASVETKIKVANLLIDKTITREQAEIVLSQLDMFMKKYLGLD